MEVARAQPGDRGATGAAWGWRWGVCSLGTELGQVWPEDGGEVGAVWGRR